MSHIVSRYASILACAAAAALAGITLARLPASAAPPTIYDLGHLGGYGSAGAAINDAGQVAGASYILPSDDSPYYAFRYDGTPGSGGVIHDLGATDSQARAINNSGQITGNSATAETQSRRGDMPLVAQGVLSAALGREDTAYHFENHDAAYQAANQRHGFVAALSEQGLVLRAGEAEWRLAFLGYGDAESLGASDHVAPTASANRVEYRRGALTEWYENGPLGLQQGFTVHEPAGADATELSLRLKMGGSLAAATDGDGRGLVLQPADGSASYRFGGLVAWDASGRSLDARLRVRGNELIYSVDVAGAHYPVVIDPLFTGGPSVRVSANDRVEFKWATDVQWFGEVWVYDNPDGTGAPLLVRRSDDIGGNPLAAMQHTITVPIQPPLAPDTGYFFKVTATDPNGSDIPISTPTPLPPFFTGAQAIGNVFVQPDIDRATISWEANVIGTGSVVYGTTALDQGPVSDAFNLQDHTIELTGLSPGTTYMFRVRNNHAIDGDSLASKDGQFTTSIAPTTTVVVLTQSHVEPRVNQPNGVATLSVVAQDGGNPVSGVVIKFEVEADSRGSGTLNGSATAQATTNASGIASVQLTATDSGIVRVTATSASARNALTLAVVVK